MVSQPGPASGRLNVSSPPKGRGFHVRFSECLWTNDPFTLEPETQRSERIRFNLRKKILSHLQANQLLPLSVTFGFIDWEGTYKFKVCDVGTMTLNKDAEIKGIDTKPDLKPIQLLP